MVGLAVETDGLDAVVVVDVLGEGEDGHVVEERVDVKVLVPHHTPHRVRLGRHDVERVLYVLIPDYDAQVVDVVLAHAT